MHCCRCNHTYPVVAGIADLRVAPDPWLSPAEDAERGMRVETESPAGFAAAVRYYWSIAPSTSPQRAARYVAHVLAAEERSRQWLQQLTPPPRASERWLDIGCGTADLLAAAPLDVEAAGLDVAMRWLIVARRRLREKHRDAVLLCGNAEALPAADGCFDRVFLLGTTEHCEDLRALCTQARRVLRPGGRIHLRTVNRHSLLAEPHVGLWGVGLLPRRWQDAYVRRRTGEGFEHRWLRSSRELERALVAAGFVAVRVAAASALPVDAARLPFLLRRATSLYERCRRLPVARSVLRALAPLLEAEGAAP